ncbi:phasin family protein [Oscillochloris sp. ZM17-4]|uniref:phasin family protein n=1 Tax=Oscillochloris sp. ZM17-4 TaxID=2866714 RepID=UPI001C731961|nr:phasin family protein [Oscillochloris sp. ZM17-4]MBX0329507.1 phasin family protein [Oscillochloris sp. ZM17-4]
MTNVEEIEVNVRQVDDATPTMNSSAQMLDLMRKLILAGVGALALSRDETEEFVNRLVERGELAQKDAQHLIDEAMERVRKNAMPQTNQVQNSVATMGNQIEASLEQFLNRLNIPSKRDIDELSAKIANLAGRVEELRRVQDTPAKGKAAPKAEAKPEA